MNKQILSSVAICFCLLMAKVSSASTYEQSLGIQGGAALPGFSPPSGTAFTLTTWNVGIRYEFEVLNDLAVTGQVSYMRFTGDAANFTQTTSDGLEYQGTLRTTSNVFVPQVGLKYRFFGGYNLAPYLETALGYSWNVFTGSKLLDGEGRDVGVPVKDQGQGAMVSTFGLSIDFRILNTTKIGIGFFGNFQWGANVLLKRWLSIPVIVEYYW